jgi:hypothetical protein
MAAICHSGEALITLSIDGETRLRWHGGAGGVPGILSEHIDQCCRSELDPAVIAQQVLSKEARGIDHGLCDAALMTCAIYYVATYAFDLWTGLEKLAAGCAIDLDLRLAHGKVEVEIFARPAIGAANVHRRTGGGSITASND